MPSTFIKTFNYDAEKKILKVVFRSGKVYEYLNVPEEIYRAMKASFSKGEYLNNHIKKNYEFKKVD